MFTTIAQPAFADKTRRFAGPPATGGGQARFTIDGSPALERHLEHACDQVLAGVLSVVPRGKIEGILLGGGYGRGEGGVWRTENEDRPYNDLEFYLFIQGNIWLNERRYGKALHELAEKLSLMLGVEVEFKVISAEKLKRSPITMHYHDLVMGHHQLWGPASLLAECDHHRLVEHLPLSEVTRLLMNRCSGLLFASERLQRPGFSLADADFIDRNLAKAQLALGDAVLAVFGRYHSSCLERQQRLSRLSTGERLPWLATIKQHHSTGIRFKLHPAPSRVSKELLSIQLQELTSLAFRVWCWLESQRLGTEFYFAHDYVRWPGDKCPETNAWRNLLINIRSCRLRWPLSPRGMRYPRERLLNALVLLLWEKETSRDKVWLQTLQTELDTSETAFSNLVNAYEIIWRRYN